MMGKLSRGFSKGSIITYIFFPLQIKFTKLKRLKNKMKKKNGM